MTRFFKQLLSGGSLLAVLMISLTAVLALGLFIPRLGYYFDDWYTLWSGVSRGAGSLASLFSSDRPFMGMLYVRTFRLFGENLLGWHLATLLLRITGGAAFYWILNLAWPKLKALFVLAAMLFVVFPGFLAEPNAATKINHLLCYASALFSIALTLQAAKTGRRAWRWVCIGLSLLLMALYLWLYEYMIGLEVLRIALLFWLRWQGQAGKFLATAKKIVLAYLPYLLLMAVFLYWRAFIFVSLRPATDVEALVTDYRSDAAGMALRLIFQTLKDFFSASVFAWFVEAYHQLEVASYTHIILATLIAAGVVLLAAGYMLRLRKPEATDAGLEDASPRALVLIGGLAALGAVFPVVLTDHYIDLTNTYKTYALQPSAGAIILLLGLALWLKPRFRNTALVALLGLSVVTQALNAQAWADDWQVQKNFFWQLTWRAPGIQDNTVLVGLAPDGYSFQQGYEVWAPVNLIYHPEGGLTPLIQSELLTQNTVLDIVQGNTVETYVRDILVTKDYHNFLLVSQPGPQSCIHVIDGKLPLYSAGERLIVQQVGAYSDPGRILPDAAPPVPPAAIFGQEPEHGWCYTYEQAELSRQGGDWGRIAALYDGALSAGLKAGDPAEYFVFIEGLANSGRGEEAKALAASAILPNPALGYSLCQSVTAAPAYPPAFGYLREQIASMICN